MHNAQFSKNSTAAGRICNMRTVHCLIYVVYQSISRLCSSSESSSVTASAGRSGTQSSSLNTYSLFFVLSQSSSPASVSSPVPVRK